ncbi:MAG: GFA family protein [Sphingomicrobium sp.]
MAYQAQCHCGAVTLEIEGELPDKAVVCNCSHCQAKGLVLAAVPGSSVKCASGEDALKTYHFNTHKIDHRFCSACGAQPFSRGADRDGSPMAMINLRCVPDVDLEAIEKIPFDGASL